MESSKFVRSIDLSKMLGSACFCFVMVILLILFLLSRFQWLQAISSRLFPSIFTPDSQSVRDGNGVLSMVSVDRKISAVDQGNPLANLKNSMLW